MPICFLKTDQYLQVISITSFHIPSAQSSCSLMCDSAYSCNVVLAGLVVIVLVIGPKVHRFTPRGGQWIFKGDKSPLA
jgi:hypothetical protein